MGDGVSGSFADWIMAKGLIDLGFSGQKFTWNHGSEVSSKTIDQPRHRFV